MADLSIMFNNLSKAAFKRSSYARIESIVDVDVQLPDDEMKPGQIQVLAVNNQTPVGEGAATFWCCWIHEPTQARFGVKIHEAGQPFGIGWQPSWQVMADHGPTGREPDWHDNGPDPANSHTWDQSIGFHIKASPVASHETLSVTVLITELPKA